MVMVWNSHEVVRVAAADVTGNACHFERNWSFPSLTELISIVLIAD